MSRYAFIFSLLFSCCTFATPDYGVDMFSVHSFQRDDADGVNEAPHFTWHNNKLYFSGSDGVNGWQLWAYEPVSQQSYMVKKFYESTGIFGYNESAAPEIVNCGAGLFISALKSKNLNSTASTRAVFYMENDIVQQIDLPQNAVIPLSLYSNGQYVLFLAWRDNSAQLGIFNCNNKQLQLVDAPEGMQSWASGSGGGIAMSGPTIIYHGSYATNTNLVNTFNINTGVIQSVLPLGSTDEALNEHKLITTKNGDVLLLSSNLFQPNGDLYLGKLNPVTGTVEQVQTAALSQLLTQQYYFSGAIYFEYLTKPGILLKAGIPAGLWFFDLSSYEITNLGQLVIEGSNYTNNSSLLSDIAIKSGKMFYRNGIWDLGTFVSFDNGPDDLLPLNNRVGVDVEHYAGYWYFPAKSQTGVELWRYKAGNGAAQVADSNTLLKSSYPANFTTHNGRLFFTANTLDSEYTNNTVGVTLFKVENPMQVPVRLPEMSKGGSGIVLRRVFNLLGHNDSLFVTAQDDVSEDIVVGLYHIPDNGFQQLYTLSFEQLDYRRDKEVIYSFTYQHKYYAVVKYQSNELNDNGWDYKAKTALVWLDDAGQTQVAVENMEADGWGPHQFHLLKNMLFYESYFEGGLYHSSALNFINLENAQRYILEEDAALIKQQKPPLVEDLYAYNCLNALCYLDLNRGQVYQIDRQLPPIDSHNLIAGRVYITYFRDGARNLMNLDNLTLVSLPLEFVIQDDYGRPGLMVPFSLDANQLYVTGRNIDIQFPYQLWQMMLNDAVEDFDLRLSYIHDAIPDIGSGYPYFAVFNGDIWAEVQRQPGRIKSSASMLYGNDSNYVKISTDFNGAGSVSASNSKILCGSSCADYVAKNTVVRLRAQAADGFKFVAWQGDCIADGAYCSVTADSNKHIRAIFAPIRYDISIEQDGRGEVVASTSQVTAEGQTVTLTLNPARGYGVKAVITGTCPAGIWLDEHTYETGIITQSCTLGVTFYRSVRRKFPWWLLGQSQD